MAAVSPLQRENAPAYAQPLRDAGEASWENEGKCICTLLASGESTCEKPNGSDSLVISPTPVFNNLMIYQWLSHVQFNPFSKGKGIFWTFPTSVEPTPAPTSMASPQHGLAGHTP